MTARIRSIAGPHLHTGRGELPFGDAALVLGCLVRPDGTPSGLLEDRLVAAEQLWRAGRVEVMVVSGSEAETRVMAAWLESRGVPGVVQDRRGLRTLDSLRQIEALGFRRPVVVTNPFHIERAVFIGRTLGLDAVGVAAPPLRRYSTALLARNHGREAIARIRAWLDLAGGH